MVLWCIYDTLSIGGRSSRAIEDTHIQLRARGESLGVK